MSSHRIARSTPAISIDGPSGSRATYHLDTPCASCQILRQSRVTIDILPDDVLLQIFHFDRILLQVTNILSLSWKWQRLVHVCRKWRSLVLASPNFLDLKLLCGPKTRAELTGIWPPLPSIIMDMFDSPMPEDYAFDAAVVHHNRVCEISLLRLTSSQLQRLASTMQEQFPALIRLMLGIDGTQNGPAQVLPDRFLGGSAQCIQTLMLHSVAFPALPKLLLSAADLVHLDLGNIPHSGYTSPEAIVVGLAVSANLRFLAIGFKSPLSRPNRESRRPPPPTRTALPALTRFEFKGGVSEYLEDLVARIDAPLLDSIWITFSQQLIFEIPQLAQFMRRTRFQALNEAHVVLDFFGVQVGYLPPIWTIGKKSGLSISCRELDWQLSSLAQVLTPFFPSIDMVERLYIYWPRFVWQDEVIETMEWLEIFHPFIAVKNLYVTEEFVQSIAFAMQGLVGERVTDVLPALESLFLEELTPSGPVQEAIGQFVGARRLLGHPIAVSHWERT